MQRSVPDKTCWCQTYLLVKAVSICDPFLQDIIADQKYCNHFASTQLYINNIICHPAPRNTDGTSFIYNALLLKNYLDGYYVFLSSTPRPLVACLYLAAATALGSIRLYVSVWNPICFFYLLRL